MSSNTLPKFPFGKYVGKTPMEILSLGDEGKSYLSWIVTEFWFVNKFDDLHEAVLKVTNNPQIEILHLDTQKTNIIKQIKELQQSLSLIEVRIQKLL